MVTEGVRVAVVVRHFVDFDFRAKDEGHPLMEGVRLNVQHPLSAGRARAASLLHDHSDGVRLIQETQAATRIAFAAVGRINVNAAAHEDAEGVCNE